MLTLQLFGGCALVAHGEAIGGPAAQRRRLALLALLGSSPGGGLSRDKLVAYFWPEDDRDRARHFLSDSLFTLRKTLGKDVLLKAGDDVRVNPDVLDVDVMQFEQIVARGDLAEAVALYRGPFLDGFFIADAPEFERWAESERDRLARRYALCVEQLATSREVISDWTTAAEWWQVLATHDPYGSRIALRAMRALEANGDAAAALRHGLAHESRVRDELGLEPDPSVVALVDRLRTRPEASLATPHDVPRVAAVAAPKHAAVPAGVPATAPGSPGVERRLTNRLVIVGAVFATLALSTFIAIRLELASPLPRLLGVAQPVHVASGGFVASVASVSRSAREDARDHYEQGRYALTKGQFDPEIHRRALALFQQSIMLDSSFALAYSGMADVYNHADQPELAKRAALRAIALDSSLAEGYTSLAYVLGWYEYRWAAADSALRHAIALNPRYVLAHLRLANQLAARERYDEAIAEVEVARELQPESFVVMLNRAMMANMAGQPDEAIQHLQAALQLEPGRLDAQYMLTMTYWASGRYADAQGVMRSIGNIAGVAAMSGAPDTMARLAPLFAASGIPDSIRLAAGMYVRLGKPTEAFEQLERLFERRDKHLAIQMRQQPFVTLRGDPRYAQLMAKLGLQ